MIKLLKGLFCLVIGLGSMYTLSLLIGVVLGGTEVYNVNDKSVMVTAAHVEYKEDGFEYVRGDISKDVAVYFNKDKFVTNRLMDMLDYKLVPSILRVYNEFGYNYLDMWIHPEAFNKYVIVTPYGYLDNINKYVKAYESEESDVSIYINNWYINKDVKVGDNVYIGNNEYTIEIIDENVALLNIDDVTRVYAGMSGTKLLNKDSEVIGFVSGVTYNLKLLCPLYSEQ